MMRTPTRVTIALTLALAAGAVHGANPGKGIGYNRDIRPILSENCFACHGPDSASRKAGLRLDQFAAATNKLDSGVTAIVPGKPDKSELVRRIFVTDEDEMPPKKIHKTLSPAQKDLLKKWVATGANYEPHWSFLAPVKSPLPSVKDPKWGRNEIDRFILARLETEKLKPNAEADRRTLLRRVSLDLTGLPPAPAAVEAFVSDPAPNSYEKAVDRLLASPQWGEHRGRYWLDAARYGDTHGIHFDNYREMWSYREWAINAFNRNQPFDQFTIENLAGDMLPNATREQKTGSGFNRCNVTSNEGGLIDEEYQVLYTRDRTEATSQVWLGLTTGCAVCHDHKYDPIAQKDFYALSAFFNNTTQSARDGNIKDTPPVIVIPKPEDDTRWAALPALVQANTNSISRRKIEAHQNFTNWLAKPDFTALDKSIPANKLQFHALLADGETNLLTGTITNSARSFALATNAVTQPGIIAAQAYTLGTNATPAFAEVGDFERTNAFSFAAWVRATNDASGTLLGRIAGTNEQRLGWELALEEGNAAARLIHSWPEDAIEIVAKKDLPKDKWVHLCVTYDGTGKPKGIKLFMDGEPQETSRTKFKLKNSIRTAAPFTLGHAEANAALAPAGLQDVRVYQRALTPTEVRELATLPRLKYLAQSPASQRTTNELAELYPVWLEGADARYQELLQTKADLAEEQKEIRQRGTVAHVMHERSTEAEAYLLFRGQYDQRRDRLTAAVPAALPPMATNAPRNRLGFAQWLVAPENPLTARVTVNRFWQELFGTGLVKTAGDFGVAGETPSHQELLDWLAVDFREHGWDVKRLFKQLVMSATYRQSALNSPKKQERDPANRLLARGPRFRMDAEMVRDYALAASGLLVEKIGGPSTRPYQPDNIWNTVGLPEGDTRNYVQDHGENLYRRSVYTFWKRQSPPASMEIFNAPSREVCTVSRERTDTPLQALVTLNDPQFVEAARQLAQASLQTEADAVDFMARRLLARPLTAKEKSIVEASATQLLAHYRAAPEEAAKLLAVGDSKPDPKLEKTQLAAYTMVANQLLNLDEVLNK